MKKIMFNDRFGLTQAVLDGLKTQTRRVISPQPVLTGQAGFEWKGKLYGEGLSEEETCRNFFNRIKTRYKVGEIIAVAQRYSDCGSANFDEWEKESDWFQKGFSNKMFVKPELMPYQIQITNIKLERLQDITDEECLAEGIWKGEFPNVRDVYYYEIIGDCKAYKMFTTPRKAYASLIDAISGKGTWDSNPYVFAYEFKLLR